MLKKCVLLNFTFQASIVTLQDPRQHRSTGAIAPVAFGSYSGKIINLQPKCPTFSKFQCTLVSLIIMQDGINVQDGITVPQGYFEQVQALEKSMANFQFRERNFSFRGLMVVQPRPQAEARHSDQEMESFSQGIGRPEIFLKPGQAHNSPTDTFFLSVGLRHNIRE